MKAIFVRCGLVVSGALLAFFTAVGTASAGDAVGNDEVLLKSGGSLRGTVVAVEPGTQVVFLVSGEKSPRTLPWAEVADVEKGKYGGGEDEEEGDAKEKPRKGDAEEEEEDGAPARPGKVRLHIESDEPVQLIEEVASSYGVVAGYGVYAVQTRVACASPCDRVVDGSRGQRFIVQGDGVPPSETFVLNDRNEDTTVKVDAGSPGLLIGGNWLTGVGAAAAVTGAVMLPIAYALDDSSSTMSSIKVAGGVTLGVGLAMLAAGIPMIIAGDTDVELTPTTTALDWNAEKSSYRPRAKAPNYWLGQF